MHDEKTKIPDCSRYTTGSYGCFPARFRPPPSQSHLPSINSADTFRFLSGNTIRSDSLHDNISEILGGHFKVLGKVIAICKDETENIDLLRKTTLSILPIDMMAELFSGFQNEDTKQFNLPELKTQISGPAVIVIPVAIYA